MTGRHVNCKGIHKMDARRVTYCCLAAVVFLAPSGCARSLHSSPVGPAQPVTDWVGLDRLFQDGGVYFGGQPTAEALRAAPERGVKMVVNLRSEPEVAALDFDEAALVRELGMEYVALPVTPSTLGPQHADGLKDVLSRTTGPILIHCGSSNRVGAVWALYLHHHRSLPLDEALNLGRRAGLKSEKLVAIIKASAN